MFTVVGYSQRKYAADRYFKEFAYKKSAKLYETIYQKGDQSYLVLSRLGDSYYFNTEPLKAEKMYAELMDKYKKEVSSKHVFRYAQALKSNGKVEESDAWLLKLKKGDSRLASLEDNSDYFVNYTNRPKTYVNIHNLSTNTKYSDFGGFIKDGKLYFASTKPGGTKFDKKLYKWNSQPYLNIYLAKEHFNEREKCLDLEDVDKLESINTRYHESNVIITKDGNTIYFTRDNYDGDKLKGDKNYVTHLKIFRATKVGDLWGKTVELPFNSDSFSCGHPALSSDEKTLYFVSDMKEGFGNTDLYKVDILGNGKYSEPKNLGSKINTEGREMFPYIDEKGTLYFASDGHLGLGALDVFESKKDDNSFTKPKNLGSPINGPLDDFAFVLDNDNGRGFFSSNRKGGKGDDDIYSFTLYKCKENIEGVIANAKTGEPIEGAEVRLINEKGEPIAKVNSKLDGSYVFYTVDCEKKFTIAASKKDYRNVQKNTETLDINKKSVTENLQLEALIVENQIVINPIYFDFNKSNIRESEAYELENIVTVMNNHPEMIIKIESHTDSRGTKEYNRRLSDKRAKSTRDYIISRGISKDRIESAIGYGEDQLLNNCNDINKNNCSEEEHQKNRRSYFYIVKGTGKR